MSELDRAANPTIEEAIKYLEGMIFTQDFSPSTLRAKAVNTMAIAALREQAERAKGCAHCNDTRCTTCCHFGWSPEICKRCENQDIYKPRPFCQFCGKRLEVEP